MNNSLPRLIDGMVATLRKEVIPHINGDFARGQAFGVIYMLSSIKLRAAWSNAFLSKQLRALEEDHLVIRKVYAEVPPRVEYTLSETGESLRPVIETLRKWGESHQERLSCAPAPETTDAPHRAA